eukprot:TRINITY_DN6973_c0_g1_i1.p1 TRINITY_DN6973_c0_g1~~TRINITY_DN6973_c0_g1_i1.p1  ORF type:complete len:137 (+),score=33.99 TRINITY_DN6973_c0_g1_i1:66-476(+)
MRSFFLTLAVTAGVWLLSEAHPQCPDEKIPVVYNNPQEFEIKNKNLVTELDILGQEYILSFDLLLASVDFDTYQNIIHLTLGGDNSVYGDRTPGLWLYKDEGFLIDSAIDGVKTKANTSILQFRQINGSTLKFPSG